MPNFIAYVVIATLLAVCATLLVAFLRARSKCTDLASQVDKSLRISMQQQHTLRERKHLDTIKDEFISTVSHELRTPLTSIRGALGLLSSGMLGEVDAKAQNLLRIASSNTDRLVRLINDILDLERMDSGRAPLQLHQCALKELVVQAVETMTPMADAAEVRLDIVPDSEDIAFEGDPDRILQVLCNLLSNAIKFSPAGSTIRLLSGIDHEEFLLRIEDRGRGVPADKLETIFDRFQQVEASDSRQKGGTGLGLAICRSIAAQHGGSIWAERNDATTPGRPGSTFVLRIPRLVGAEGVRPLPIKPSGAVLVCDDDAGIRHIVAEQLRLQGYTVLEAERGEQAIQLAEHQHIDAILLDLYMPGLSGWETLERLKTHPNTADIPVVILSVLSPAARAPDGTSIVNTAQGWVQKPFNESLLLSELGRVLHAGAGQGRILLVEDDLDLATVVISGFDSTNEASSAGITIEHVTSLHDAKQACLAAPPDILILDLTLPDGSGFSLVDWLRKQPSLRTLPMVVYSGRHVTAAEMDQLRLGPTQFLAKARVQPQDVEDLVLAMVRHLRSPAYDIDLEPQHAA